MTAAHLDKRQDLKPVERQARVEGDTEWIACGNVTMVESASRAARWLYSRSKIKRLPKVLHIMVRDMEQPELEFRHEVTVSVDVTVKPLRGAE